jgi:hypothetical protein
MMPTLRSSSHGRLNEDTNRPNMKEPENDEAKASAVSSPDQSPPVQSLRDLLATLKRPSDIKCFRSLGKGGVFKILTWLHTPPVQPTSIAVYDALPPIALLHQGVPRQTRVESKNGRRFPWSGWKKSPTRLNKDGTCCYLRVD